MPVEITRNMIHSIEENYNIWRYLDLVKFLDLIINERIYFADPGVTFALA
jgi:hypothetical protein